MFTYVFIGYVQVDTTLLEAQLVLLEASGARRT